MGHGSDQSGKYNQEHSKEEMAMGRSYMQETGRQMEKVTDEDIDNVSKQRARQVARWRDEITKLGANTGNKKPKIGTITKDASLIPQNLCPCSSNHMHAIPHNILSPIQPALHRCHLYFQDR